MTDDAAPTRWDFETLDVRLVERWLAARPDDAVPAVADPRRRRLRYAYLDTAGVRLLSAGYGLRVLRRRGRTSAELTALRAKGDENSFVEEVASGAPSVVARADGPVGTRARLLCGRSPLRKLIDLDVVETRRAIRDGEVELGVLELEDASVALEDGRRRMRVERVRVEAAPGVDSARIAGFVTAMQGAVDLREARLGTFEAAVAARGIAVPAPTGLGPVEIAPTSTLGEVAFAVLRRQFAVFLAKEPGTRLGDDPEELHDMRVATRRMRAAMSLFRDALPPRASALRDELKWVAGALGEVRDLDVQAEHFAEWAAQDERLGTVVLESGEREAARRRMLEVLDSPRCRRFVRAFTAMLRRGPASNDTAASSPATALAPDLALARRRKVRKAGGRLTLESPPEAYHAMRIRCKRLRYALEFLAEIYGEPAKTLAARLAEVQDVLGRHQDAYVAIHRIEAMLRRPDAPGTAGAFAMGVAAERCAQVAARLREQFPRAYARTRGRPWRRLRKTMEKMRPPAAPMDAPASDEPAPALQAPPSVDVASIDPPATTIVET